MIDEDGGMNEISFLKEEMVKLENRIQKIQKQHKKFEDMLKNKKHSKEFVELLSKAFYIQGKLSVLDEGFEHKPDLSYIG